MAGMPPGTRDAWRGGRIEKGYFLVVVFNVVIYLPKREVMGLELASELPSYCVKTKEEILLWNWAFGS